MQSYKILFSKTSFYKLLELDIQTDWTGLEISYPGKKWHSGLFNSKLVKEVSDHLKYLDLNTAFNIIIVYTVISKKANILPYC